MYGSPTREWCDLVAPTFIYIYIFHPTFLTQISSYIFKNLFYCVHKSIIWITRIKSANLNFQMADKEIPIFTKILLIVIILYVETNFNKFRITISLEWEYFGTIT